MTAGSRRGASPLHADGSAHEFPPAAFGPFRVLHQVGAGSLGPVFRAHDPAENRLVALKAFKLDLTPERAQELAAALEDLVAAAPRHPAMAAAVAAGVAGSTPYLAQEYVPGEALDAALRQFGPPPPGDALAILARLAEALDRAAGEGIHHGALHPRDILVTDTDTRLIDLGVAQALERCGLRAPIRRPYAAPERTWGESWGGAADIYALGAIAFELLTGRRIAGTGVPVGRLEGLSGAAAAEVGDVLARALHEQPSERYPSAADLVDALRPALVEASRTAPGSIPPEAVAVALPLDEDSGPTSGASEPAARASETAEPPPLAAAAAGADLVSEAPPMWSELAEPDELLRVSDDVTPEPPGRYTDWEEPEPAAAVVEGDHRPAADATEAFPEPLHRHADEASFVTRDEAIPAAPRWQEPPAARSRGPLLALVMAILVGLAAGFGWGYWTAWRSLSRQPAAADVVAAGTVTSPADSAGMPDGSTRVEDPEVVGERGLASPSAAPSRTAKPPAPARANTPAPAPAPERRAPRREPPPPASSSDDAGRMLVRSTPAGARVLVNGEVLGSTPAAIRDLPLGAFTLTLERDGYIRETRRVALTRERPVATLDVPLVAAGTGTAAPMRVVPAPLAAPAGSVGVLVVESRPTGARVVVDGQPIGTTPLSLPEAAAGRRTVRLEMDGFLPWATTVEVQPGERTRVAASLEQGAPR